MIEHRPCGICRALVPAATGCEHWKPSVSRAMRARAEPADREARAKAADKRRHQRKRARERAKASVDAFYREQELEKP